MERQELKDLRDSYGFWLSPKAILLETPFIRTSNICRFQLEARFFQLGFQIFQLGVPFFQLGSQIFQLSNRSTKIPSKKRQVSDSE